MENEIKIKEIEVAKLNLQPGDMLMVTIKNDEVTREDLTHLHKQLSTLIPDNQIFLMNTGTNGDIKFSVVSSVQNDYSCSNSPVGYCSDCNCGKRETIEGSKNE